MESDTLTDDLALEGQATTDALVEEMALSADFSPKAHKALLQSMNTLLPAFGVTEDLKVEIPSDPAPLDMEINRWLLTFRDAINDAVEDEVLDAEMHIDFEGITGDPELTALAGRLRMAASDKGFKKWLKEERPGEEEEEESAEDATSTSTGDIEEEDELLLSRI
jgi:hypothetical protein